MIEQNLVAHIQTFGQWKIFQLTQWLFEKKKKERETWREENDFWINYIDEISNLFGYFDFIDFGF